MGFESYLNTYTFKCVLPGSKQEVEYKAITTGQIKGLLVYENETNPIILENAFDNLITSSVLSKDFNIDDLYLEDRNYLLIELRKVTKGDVYSFSFTCPECKNDNLSSINFEKLEVIEKPEVKDNEIVINKEVSIFIDHITRGDQKLSYSKINTKNRTQNQIQADMVLNTLTTGIKKVVSPDGDETDLDFDKKNMIMSDFVTFENFENIKE